MLKFDANMSLYKGFEWRQYIPYFVSDKQKQLYNNNNNNLNNILNMYIIFIVNAVTRLWIWLLL